MNAKKKNGGSRQFALCFHIHQPVRIGTSNADDITSCFDKESDQRIMERVAGACYLPTNELLLKLIKRHPQLKVTFSISGLALEQMEQYAPAVLESFRALAATGSVDFLSETYYHSLAFLMDSDEFEIQILEHAEKISQLFNVYPLVFRNTSLFYNDDIGRRINMMGFRGVITDGSQEALKGARPHCLYEHRDRNGLNIITRNPSLSNDIAFDVSSPARNLTAEEFMFWLEQMPGDEKLVVVDLDYSTFGEHHKPETGIMHFLERLFLMFAMQRSYKMVTPSSVVRTARAARPLLAIPEYVTYEGCNMSTWIGNEKQREAFSAMAGLEASLKEENNPELLKAWRYLQASDHFYDMSDHSHPFSSPSSQEVFEKYMHAVARLKDQVSSKKLEKMNKDHEAGRRDIKEPVWARSLESHHG